MSSGNYGRPSSTGTDEGLSRTIDPLTVGRRGSSGLTPQDVRNLHQVLEFRDRTRVPSLFTCPETGVSRSTVLRHPATPVEGVVIGRYPREPSSSGLGGGVTYKLEHT